MGRKTLRKPHRNESMRPSNFFIIALAAGVIMLVVIAVMYIRHPPSPQAQPQPQKRTSVAAHYLQRPA